MKTAGLSLDQAPPIWVPFSFFLAAPLFALTAAALLVWQGEAVIASRWTAPALAIVHLLALGFLTQAMCGALLQMLPVLVGSPVPRVALVGPLTQILLCLGTLALSFGLYLGAPVWLILGAACLGLGLGGFGLAAAVALLRARSVQHTRTAMGLALSALAATLALGLALVAALAGIRMADFVHWVNLHLAWGLLGWAGVLIMGVGYQVVPMFHVTPAYPNRLMRWAAPLVTLGLIAATSWGVAGRWQAAGWCVGLALSAFLLFAAVTLDRQRRRERRRIDATLLHWWSAMACAFLAAAGWIFGGRPELIGVLVLIGTGVGLPSGMLFKIAPFLSWFHLQHRQVTTRRFDVRIPHMQVFVPDRLARTQFGLHLATLILLATAAAIPDLGTRLALGRIGGILLGFSSALLWWLLAGCFLRYRDFNRRLS